jgi:DNA-directed RNA polymerase specialized sigma subunit
MTSKEFLDRPYHIKKKIRYLELELDRYKVMMNSIPQPSYGTVRVDKTPSGETPNQKALEKYYETEDKIAEKKAELERVIAEITTVIDRIDNEDYKLLLKYRYIDLKNITEIANLLFISIRTAQRWHRLALEEIILEA